MGPRAGRLAPRGRFPRRVTRQPRFSSCRCAARLLTLSSSTSSMRRPCSSGVLVEQGGAASHWVEEGKAQMMLNETVVPAFRCAVYGDVPAHEPHQPFADGQAQAGALVLTGIASPTWVKGSNSMFSLSRGMPMPVSAT